MKSLIHFLNVLLTWTLGLMLFGGSLAQAQSFPTKPIKIIAPFAAGGLADTLARTLAEKLTRALGQPVLVENKMGAGGNIGADAVARAEPDGYTLMMSSAGILTINQFLYPSMSFDANSAFAPVSLVADMPMVLVVRKDLPAKNLSEFLALAKNTPGGLFYGSPGNGTTGHLGMELFMHATGVRLQHVPYKSAAEAVQAALSAQTSTMFDNPPSIMTQIKSGSLRAIGVATKERMAQLPEVPTLMEGGLNNFEASSWFGLVAPAKTPRPIVDKLAQETSKALKDSELQARFYQAGAKLIGNTPEQFSQIIAEDKVRWEKVIRQADIKLQ
jgi:tripartite-type tricarboxylate transporter receptor subunit TctC